jgi:hypothetical protein
VNAAAADWHIQAVDVFLDALNQQRYALDSTGNLKTNTSIKFHLGFLFIFLQEMVG